MHGHVTYKIKFLYSKFPLIENINRELRKEIVFFKAHAQELSSGQFLKANKSIRRNDMFVSRDLLC